MVITTIKRVWKRLALACFVLGWAWAVWRDSRSGREF